MKPPRTWVTTDWHLFHNRLIQAGERPVDSQELLLANHRKLINPQDTTINLGDLIFYQLPRLAEIMATIPGRHVLVLGNHDRKTRGWYMRNGFAFAADAIVWDDVMFTHKPVDNLPEGVRINIHGHLHKHREYANKQAFHRLIAMEDTGYKPVLLDTLINEVKGDDQ